MSVRAFPGTNKEPLTFQKQLLVNRLFSIGAVVTMLNSSGTFNFAKEHCRFAQLGDMDIGWPRFQAASALLCGFSWKQ